MIAALHSETSKRSVCAIMRCRSLRKPQERQRGRRGLGGALKYPQARQQMPERASKPPSILDDAMPILTNEIGSVKEAAASGLGRIVVATAPDAHSSFSSRCVNA